MERRGAIKYLTLATGAFFITPAWATNWTKASVGAAPACLSVEQGELLAEVVETIIPKTDSSGVDSPGAKDLGVPAFVQRMVTDCYEKAAQEKVKSGLAAVSAMSIETYGKPFEQANTAQRLALLTRMATSTDANQKEFLTLMKALTIQGYTTSEYVMTNFYHYVMAPGHYYGCVPVQAKAITQSK